MAAPRSLAFALSLVLSVGVATSGCGGSSSSSRSLTRAFSSRGDGVTVRYPEGWRITTRNSTFVPNPALCFELRPQSVTTNAKVDVKVVEYLPPYVRPSDYRPRPGRFRLTMLRPSDSDWTTGRTLAFRDKKRVFLVGVIVPAGAGASLRRTIESALDSLTITGGHRCRPSAGVGSLAGTAPLTAPAPMMRTPSLVSMFCRPAKYAGVLCPTRLPKTDPGGYYALVFGHAGFAVVSISNGGIEYPYNVRRDAPPRFVHVVLEAGDLSQAFQTFTYPTGGKPTPIRNGLLLSRDYKRAPDTGGALYLGRVRWSGRAGSLALVAPYSAVDSIVAGHLIFRWRKAGRDYAVSLHAWEPFRQTVGTLEAIVASIPR